MNKASQPSANGGGCLRYWDMCETMPIAAVVALWCDVDAAELADSGISTGCMEAKRQAIIDALVGKRLEYEDSPVPRSDGRGMWYGAPLKELIDKDGVRINKESLRRWFLDMPSGDRPAFLFDEARQADMLPDGGGVAEMNAMRAVAIMAWMLSENKTLFTSGGRPNASTIGQAIEARAKAVFGKNVRGLSAFHKRITRAVALLDGDVDAGMFSFKREK